jgi:uncharacterized alkaline shock family protein YloU
VTSTETRGDATPPRSGAPEARGTTEIRPRAVEQIAARAAADVDGVAGTVHVSGVRRLFRSGSTPSAAASASVSDGSATITLHCNVRYPAPVFEVAQRVRECVTREVTRFTGLRIDGCDITIEELVRHEPRRRVR